MKILIFGGNGFVGLNIAAALLARGHAVTLFDRVGLPPAAAKDFASPADSHPGRRQGSNGRRASHRRGL
jgi:UDP-glucose 4-epimerase